MNILFDGESAYKIKALLVNKTDKAFLLDCEGDEVWVPRSVCKVDALKQIAIIKSWWYKKKQFV
jgi:hypothetical protein